MLAECFERVLRAGGRESAAGLLERRDADLIEPDQEYERENEDFSGQFLSFVQSLVHWP